jgi:hypothetical protein
MDKEPHCSRSLQKEGVAIDAIKALGIRKSRGEMYCGGFTF